MKGKVDFRLYNSTGLLIRWSKAFNTVAKHDFSSELRNKGPFTLEIIRRELLSELFAK